jgi:hypothetical protein
MTVYRPAARRTIPRDHPTVTGISQIPHRFCVVGSRSGGQCYEPSGSDGASLYGQLESHLDH